MRVVIGGGTGFIGRALGHALVARGDQAVILTRGQPYALAHACSECGAGGKVEFVNWTPEKAGDWMKVVDGADAVVNLAGANVGDQRWSDERKHELWESRVASTKLLAQGIAEAKKKPSVFVSGSASGYYGVKTRDTILTEHSAPGTDFLARLTVAWEDAARPAREAGVRVCHPRTGLVLGPRGGLYGKLAPIFRSFVGGPIGDGTQFVPWVHQRDVVSALEAMIDRTDFSGAFNLTAPEPVTMNTFADELGASLGRPAAMRVPPFAIKLALGTEAAEVILSGPRAVPERLMEAGFAFLFPELRSALADLAS